MLNFNALKSTNLDNFLINAQITVIAEKYLNNYGIYNINFVNLPLLEICTIIMNFYILNPRS